MTCDAPRSTGVLLYSAGRTTRSIPASSKTPRCSCFFEADLALAAAACGTVIPFDAGVGGQLYRIDDPNRRAQPRAQPDPGHAAAARKAGAQIGEGGVVIEHVG